MMTGAEKRSRPTPFLTTRWSVVAGSEGAAAAKDALTELSLRNWYPVYAYVRRCGHAPEAAQALTTGFFRELLSGRLKPTGAEPPPRFREFLLQALHSFLASGGSSSSGSSSKGPSAGLPLPPTDLEARVQAEAAVQGTPEQVFARSFAVEFLARAMHRLRREADQAGRLTMFERLEPFLTREPAPGELDAEAQRLKLSPLAALMALKRLRQRFRELVDDDLADTVGNVEGLHAEREALLAILGSAN